MRFKCMAGLSGLPTIENPSLYRKSVQRLVEEVRPKRLYLGHPFPQCKWRDYQSAQVDGEAGCSRTSSES